METLRFLKASFIQQLNNITQSDNITHSFWKLVLSNS